MKVFVTGATGYIGSALVAELTGVGHHVAGLTRSPDNVALIEGLGARAVVGDLRDAESLRAELGAVDALVHAAADESEDGAEVDRAAVDALLEAAAGRPSTLVYTSGCFVLGETGDEPADEDAPTDGAPEIVAWRAAHEERVLAAAGPGLATAVVRPGMVYGGHRGMFAGFFETAEEKGSAAIVGDGANRWSPVYRGDVARLYRMIIEAEAGGIFHCAEPAEQVEMLAAAASAAAGAGGTRHVPLEEARREMGAFADALTMDQVVGCSRARSFGWAPRHAPFVDSADALYREWKKAS